MTPKRKRGENERGCVLVAGLGKVPYTQQKTSALCLVRAVQTLLVGMDHKHLL